MASMPAGLLWAVGAAVANGSFGSLFKLAPVRREQIPPLALNYWFAEGVGLSGLLLLAWPSCRVFTWWGLLSGLLLTGSAAGSVAAVQLLGLSAGSAIWCGTAVIVSFCYATLVVGEQVAQPQLAAAGLVLLLAGISFVSAAGYLGGTRDDTAAAEAGPAAAAEQGSPGGARDAEAATDELEQPLLEGQRLPGQQRDAAQRFLLGAAAAVAAGVLGGLILAPMLRAPSTAQGPQFLPSLAAGTLLWGPVLTMAFGCGSGSVEFLQLQSSAAAWPGMAAGIVWNAGNLASTLAVRDPRVGLAVAYPIMQAGLLVGGLWGILAFGEMRGRRALIAYWIGGAAVVAGAALLASAK